MKHQFPEVVVFIHKIVAFTPKGGCPLKPKRTSSSVAEAHTVAFTPKGGCPLKLPQLLTGATLQRRSIHPQGWVPIETHNRLVRLQVHLVS